MNSKMGYCAKVRIFSQHLCVIVLFLSDIKNANSASSIVPGKSWPKLKTYDIWGPPAQTETDPLHIQRSRFTSSNDLLVREHQDKTSFRNGKGILIMSCVCVTL